MLKENNIDDQNPCSIAGHAEVKGFQLKGMRVEEILNAKDS